jgi:hypothetical protein
MDNTENLKTNSYIHRLSTRHKYDLDMPNANPTTYHKGVYYASVKLFNALPSHIKTLNCDFQIFKPAPKDYFLSHSFYSAEEFTSIENT